MKRFIEGTSGWAFGLALSVLLISIWGRAVVVDSETLGEALSPLAGSMAVVDQVAGWLSDELVEVGVASPSVADTAVSNVLENSSVDDVLDDLVARVVDAAATSEPAGASVDIYEVVAPAVPELAASLNSSGVIVTEDEVRGALAAVDPLVIREPGLAPVIGPESPVAARLGAATLLALLAMVVAGSIYVRAKGDRVAATRALLTRVALSGLSFGLMLRLGSWVLDPEGGRAPISSAIGGVAGAKWLIPIGLGCLAAMGAGTTYFFRRKVRRVATSPGSNERPKQLSGSPQ